MPFQQVTENSTNHTSFQRIQPEFTLCSPSIAASYNPWQSIPRRLVSLWEIVSCLIMGRFKADRFYLLGGVLEMMQASHQSAKRKGSPFYGEAAGDVSAVNEAAGIDGILATRSIVLTWVELDRDLLTQIRNKKTKKLYG